jgi:cytidyltransferase-like protein
MLTKEELLYIEQLKEIKKTKRVAMCHGVFDVLHYEHLELFDFAKRHADYVIVSLVADRFVDKGPGRPVIDEAHRKYMLESLRSIDKAILTKAYYPFAMIMIYKPDVWIHGGRDQLGPEEGLLKRLGIPIIVRKHNRTVSTTDILNRIKK